MKTDRRKRWSLLPLLVLTGLASGTAEAQMMPKAQVANLIVKVENGVDQFRDYLKRKGDNARTAAESPQGQARRGKRGGTAATAPNAEARKDELDDALGDLNRSTNRLRRKFDATDTWMETKPMVNNMLDDGRKINQALTRGNYGTEAARLWGVLRTGMNDLARAYGLAPMAF